MQAEDLRLDGNAAGGMLLDVFDREMTMVLVSCAGCGAEGRIGELLEYGQPMGLVLRCPTCDVALLRIVHTATFNCVDATGVKWLRMPENRIVA